MAPDGASPPTPWKKAQYLRCHRFHAVTATANARAPCALQGIPARVPSNEMLVIPSANMHLALHRYLRQFSNTKTALARTGLHRLVPVPDASSKTSMAPSVPIDVPPNHPTSHMRALDQDDEGASSYQPDAAQIQGGRHIPWKIEGFYFLSRDRYKALYFNLLKTIRLAAIGCDDKDGEAGRD